MKTFAELEQAKAEGKACENCAWRGETGVSLYCLNPDSRNTAIDPKYLCRQYTDTLPENLQEDENTRTIMV